MIRAISLFCSKSFSSFAKTFGVMPSMLFCMSVNRSFPTEIEIIIGNFHLPLMILKASLTGRTVFMHEVYFLFSIVIYLAFLRESGIQRKVKNAIFASMVDLKRIRHA